MDHHGRSERGIDDSTVKRKWGTKMREWLKCSVILALGIALFGCLSTPVRTVVQVQVSGYARAGYSAATQKYLILPAEKGISPDDLEFSEYASYVDYALGKEGFQKATHRMTLQWSSSCPME